MYCLSVNDAFTMFQWGKHLGVMQVKMLPDGNGDLTEVWVCWLKRKIWALDTVPGAIYPMLVDDKNIVELFSEPGKSDNCPDDPFTVSNADTMLDFLKKQ